MLDCDSWLLPRPHITLVAPRRPPGNPKEGLQGSACNVPCLPPGGSSPLLKPPKEAREDRALEMTSSATDSLWQPPLHTHVLMCLRASVSHPQKGRVGLGVLKASRVMKDREGGKGRCTFGMASGGRHTLALGARAGWGHTGAHLGTSARR